MEEYGYINIKLKEILDRKKITRTSLARITGLRYEIIAQYYNGEVKRVDLVTVSKICHVLKCKINDILEYIPEENGTSRN